MRSRPRIHVDIGDTQAKRGVPVRHMRWIGRYIAEHCKGKDTVVNHLGDNWDFPSLSVYDRGKKDMEGRRLVDDVEAGNEAFELLTEPMQCRGWKPELHFYDGNHEDRLNRWIAENAQLEGAIGPQMNAAELGWTVHPFLEPVTIDGVTRAHYFYNPNTGRPYSGENMDARLKTIGHSFTQGHQQGIKYGVRPVGRTRHHGLVLGSSYLHDENYLGPQATAYWRGIVVCHQVEAGTYDPMMVSLEYLCRRYERMTLRDFLAKEKRRLAA